MPAPAEPSARVTFCFAPGTPGAVRDAWARASRADGGKAFTASDGSRWSRTATDGIKAGQGVPITLTWGIVPDGTPVPADFGSPAAPSNLRAWLDQTYGGEPAWVPLFENVFARWGELCGVTYVHETHDDGATLNSAAGVLGVRPDIRIAGHAIDGDYGVLAYNAFPNDGDMVIDTTDAFLRSTSSSSRRLRNVIAHEHGHGLGLDHVCPITQTKLMEPNASSAYDGPQHDDVLGAQRLYGDASEPNEGIAAATDLGAPGTKKITLDNVSIDDDGDQDHYAFLAPQGSFADVTVTPVGKVYNSGPQASGGGCGATSQVDTRVNVDLRLALLAADGTVLANVDDTGRGGAEELLDVALPFSGSAGDLQRYVVRVRGAGENAAQLYRLTLNVAQRGEKPEAQDDAASTFEVLPVEIAVLENDTGLADVPITLRLAEPPAVGRVVRVDERLHYVPARGFTGRESFTYSVIDVHGQSSTATVTVDVAASARAGDARIDSDADGYPDELEVWLGTSVGDASSRPGEDITSGARPLVVTRLRTKISARRPESDKLTLRCELPVDEGFEPDGAVVRATVGGVARSVTLDRRGRLRVDAQPTAVTAESPGARLRIKRRKGVVRGGSVRFDLSLRHADIAADVADEGLDVSRRQRREPRAITVFVLFDGRTFEATVPLSVRADAGRSGRGKDVR